MSVPNFFQFYCAVNSHSLKRLTYRMYIISDIKQGLPIFPSQICYSWANSLLDLLHQTFQTLASPTITLLNVKEQPANHFLHAHHPLQGTSWTNVLPLIGFSQSLLENSPVLGRMSNPWPANSFSNRLPTGSPLSDSELTCMNFSRCA